jgi:hypothetical protein
MATNFCEFATQAPMRGVPRTSGRVSSLSFLSLARPFGEIVSPVMSGMTFDKSLILPFLSKMPGFSLPFGP